MHRIKATIERLALDSLFDYKNYLHPKEVQAFTDLAHADKFLHNYRVKNAIARYFQPSSVFEIGVRAGYSAAAFLSNDCVEEYLGLDINLPVRDGGARIQNFPLHAEKMLKERFVNVKSKVTIDTSLSHATIDFLSSTYSSYFDLIHVDGNHEYMPCLTDIITATILAKDSGVIVVDDYTYEVTVASACHNFLKSNNAYEGILIPSYRGDFIIKRRNT